jgi:hypothetical protein
MWLSLGEAAGAILGHRRADRFGGPWKLKGRQRPHPGAYRVREGRQRAL